MTDQVAADLPETLVLFGAMRKVDYRTHRALKPKHTGRKAFIGKQQLRILPGQKLNITKATFLDDFEEIKEWVADHVLEVHTVDGRIFDLGTLKPQAAAPPAEVRPNIRPDSVKYDRPTGMYIPPYVGDDGAMPQVLPTGEKPELLKNAEDTTSPIPVAEPVKPPVDELDAQIEAAKKATQEPVQKTTSPSDWRKNKRK